MSKLTNRTIFYLAAVLSPAVVFVIMGVVLMTRHIGDSMPRGFKIGAPVVLYLMTVAFFLTHPPKNVEIGKKETS